MNAGGTGLGALTPTPASIRATASNIQIRQRDKDHVDVTATKNGKVEKLAVDPQSGAVKPDTDNDD
jgi:hypothetical protein